MTYQNITFSDKYYFNNTKHMLCTVLIMIHKQIIFPLNSNIISIMFCIFVPAT